MRLVDRLRKNIETLLDAKGWKRADLARRAVPHGITRAYVYMICRGDYDPSLDKLEAIAKGFGLSSPLQLLSENPLDDPGPDVARLTSLYRRATEQGRETILQVAEAQAAFQSESRIPH